MSWTLSRRAQRLNPSVIREILKITVRPDVISFAGGLPAAELFPAEAAGDPVLLKVARRARNNDLLQTEAQALRKDRNRLVQELNEVRGKASELAKAGRDAAGRIESAMARIRGVLGS